MIVNVKFSNHHHHISRVEISLDKLTNKVDPLDGYICKIKP